jgi:hypothetical protein
LKNILNLPHRVCESTCYVNGLEDMLEWKGVKYTNYLLSILGGMGEFAYLKFKAAKPPCMVYCGANPKYLMNDLEKIIGFKQEIIENRVFKSTFPKIKEFIDLGLPVVAGALDMYYLHYYKDLYKKQHVPIHYVLVAGYDDNKELVFVHDCTYQGVKEVSYNEFEKALDVNVSGMSKKNTIRTFIMPDKLPTEFEIAKEGLNLRAEKMLNPPVSMYGIPAMKKLSKEILNWKDKDCFNHLVMYATVPPHIPKNFNNSNGMRLWKADILQELGNKYNIINWVRASELFGQSGKIIIDICKAAVVRDSQLISDLIFKVAVIEEEAYKLVKT